MATLVLSNVGTAIGGPVGGALGSMIGQAIDTNLFGPGPRRGPRLDDLKVQTSSYGTQIPRIYGRMRVAGTIVWATDLKESEQVEGGGKGGQESIHYNYSCSFAVALSSRPIAGIGRIWADGKLIRGEAGDLKVKGALRVLQGTEDQVPDPLIATLEGDDGTPAYRGLALAVFEDLDLAEFGNRLPMLTVEVVADEGDRRAAGIVGDVCAVMSVGGEEGEAEIVGFAAMGTDRRSAIEGLVELNALALTEDGDSLHLVAGKAPEPIQLGSDSGWSADGKVAPAKGEWTREPATAVPAALSVRYHEPSRDFQAGLMTSTAQGGRGEALFDCAAALSGETAKTWAANALARRWAGRDRLALTLSSDWIGLAPGDQLTFDWRSGLWTVEEVLVEAFAVKVSCRRSAEPGTMMQAESGRGLPQADVPVGASVIRTFEMPDVVITDGMPRLQVAVSCDGLFKRVAVTSNIMSSAGPSGTAWRKARLGFAETALAVGPGTLVDRTSSVVVALVDALQILLHADADALDAGANLAMIGEELFQFGRAEPLGEGRYRLSHLLRGRGGSEWAIGRHTAGEAFVMVDSAALVPLAFDPGLFGSELRVNAVGVADDESAPPSTVRTLSGASNAPIAPCHVSVRRGATTVLTWVERSRDRFGWNDGSDAAVASGTYAVTLVGSAGTIERTVSGDTLELIESDLTLLGAGVIEAAVRQLGASRSSEAATLQFFI